MSLKILFISHEASRTGAPILLLNLAKLVKNSTDYEIKFLLKFGGILEQEFADVAPTEIIYFNSDNTFFKVLSKLKNNFKWRGIRASIRNFDIVISNTITNGVLDNILKRHKKVFTYVHELPVTIKQMVTENHLKNVLRHTYYFMVPSLAVKNNLHDNYHVPESKLILLPYYIPDYFQNCKMSRKEMRNKLGIDENIFVIGGMGSLGWRKGTDIFVQVSNKFSEQKDIKFVWCGGNQGGDEHLSMQSDIKKLGLEKSMILLESQNDSWKIMSVFDVFFLSSREDPYPLVVLEAAMMAKPIICFEKSGGAVEFVGAEAGYIVPYLSIELVTQKINLLKNDRLLYNKHSSCAREMYVKKHTSTPVLNRFLNTVEVLN